MSRIDVQRFTQDSTWVKPPGAVRTLITMNGSFVASRAAGPVLTLTKINTKEGTATTSYAAADLPDLVSVEVSQAGGYAVITTRLAGA